MTIIVYDRAARQIAADRLCSDGGASFEVPKLHKISVDGKTYIVGTAGNINAVGEFLSYIQGHIEELPLGSSGQYSLQAIVVDVETGNAVLYECSPHPIPLGAWGSIGASEGQFAAQVLRRMGMSPQEIIETVCKENNYSGCDVYDF